MADVNSFTFTGRLTKDAQIKTTQTGKTYLECDVANNIGYGEYQKTNWLKVKMWGERAANVAPIFTKGSLVGGSGEFSTDEYDDKNGVHRTTITITVNNLQLLIGKKTDSNPAPAEEPDPAVF